MAYIENQDDDSEKRGDNLTVLDAESRTTTLMFRLQPMVLQYLKPTCFSGWWFSDPTGNRSLQLQYTFWVFLFVPPEIPQKLFDSRNALHAQSYAPWEHNAKSA